MLAGCAASDVLQPRTCEGTLTENDWTRHGRLHVGTLVQEAD